LIAAVFEFAGAVLAGGQVTSTIRKGIIDVSGLGATPEILVMGMLAALLAAGTWLLVASHKGWPVSTTHSIVGSIVGFHRRDWHGRGSMGQSRNDCHKLGNLALNRSHFIVFDI